MTALFERLARKALWRTDPVAAVAEYIAQDVVCFLNFTEAQQHRRRQAAA